jgi:hypothetical protein
MSSTLSSTRSWFSADPTKALDDATLVPAGQSVPADTKNKRLLIKLRSLDKQILLAIAFPITFCIGIAAGSVWQSSSSLSDLAQRADLGRIGALIRPFLVAGWDAVGQFPHD